MVRRIVTGNDKNGHAIFVSDGTPPWSKQYEHTPGFASTVVWTATSPHRAPNDGSDSSPQMKNFVPAPGESRFVVVSFPPDSVFADPKLDFAAAMKEQAEQSPGLTELFEPDNPGMHKTPTIDYGIVLDGEVWLELDDGKQILLKRHDTIVQNGTRHAWRNKSDKPVTMAFVLIGAVK